MARKKVIPEVCCAKCIHYDVTKVALGGLHPCDAPVQPFSELPASVRAALLSRRSLPRAWMPPFAKVQCVPFRLNKEWENDERLIRCGNK